MELSPVAARILANVLEEKTGQELSPGRQWRIMTALSGLLSERRINGIDALAAMLSSRHDALLGEYVAEALLNNETFFFRDFAAFGTLTEQALPRLALARAGVRRLRIWSAGCSTGQEAYSLAMHFADHPERWAGWQIQILATDVSRTAIGRARAGVYNQFEIQRGLPVRQMMRWFDVDGESWRARPELVKLVHFQVHNLCNAPPPGPFDLILCRNVLLYFAAKRRTSVLGNLAKTMAADGALMLGAGETIIGQTNDFTLDTDCRGMYRPSPT